MVDPRIGALRDQVETLWRGTVLGTCAPIEVAPQHDGSAHVEISSGGFDIVSTERGRETGRVVGLSLDEAARWLLGDRAVRHAMEQELRLRCAPEDAEPLPTGVADDGYSRWNWMAPAIKIMERISPDHGAWMRDRFAAVLQQSPLQAHEKRNARWPLPPWIA